MRIRMERDRIFRVPSNRAKSVEYRAGFPYTVRREWGDAMVADGDAVEVPAPPRPTRTRRKAQPAV